MDWIVRIESDHILIECEGEVDIEVAKQVASDAYALAAEHHKDKILIDWRRLTGAVSDIDRYEMGRHVAEAYVSQRPIRFVRIAVVGSPPILSPTKLGETVARNRGAEGIVTSDIAEAREYLGISGPDERAPD